MVPGHAERTARYQQVQEETRLPFRPMKPNGRQMQEPAWRTDVLTQGQSLQEAWSKGLKPKWKGGLSSIHHLYQGDSLKYTTELWCEKQENTETKEGHTLKASRASMFAGLKKDQRRIFSNSVPLHSHSLVSLSTSSTTFNSAAPYHTAQAPSPAHHTPLVLPPFHFLPTTRLSCPPKIDTWSSNS